MPSAPLDGITVLNLATVGPAARAGRTLADYGARVIKVGAVPRRGGVQIVPPYHTYSASRGMEPVQLDLKAAEGVEAFLRLTERADVVIESFRPGVVARLGVGYEAVSQRNPAIVYCSTSGFGQDGARARWAGHDVNYLAVGGFLACTAPGAEGVPPLPGATIADGAGGGMHAVISILAALVERGRTGRGRHLDVSVTEGVLSLMALYVDEYLATGHEVAPGSDLLSGRYACYQTYRTKDGRGIAVGAIEPVFWKNLCEGVGLSKWIAHQNDDAVREEVIADFRRVFLERDRDAWVEALAGNDTCVAPILSVAEVAESPELQERGCFVEAEHPQHGRFVQVAPTLAGGDRETRVHPVPDLAETRTAELLGEAGYAEQEVHALQEAGIVA